MDIHPTHLDADTVKEAERMLAAVKRRLIDRQPHWIDTDQLVVEASLAVYEEAQRWQPSDGPYPAVVYCVARRRVITEIRRQAGFARRQHDGNPDARFLHSKNRVSFDGPEGAVLANIIPDYRAANEFVRAEWRIILEPLYARLDDQEWAAVRAVIFDGLTPRAELRRTGMSKSWIYMLLARATEKMRTPPPQPQQPEPPRISPEELRAAREITELHLSAFARALGIRVGDYSRYEAGVRRAPPELGNHVASLVAWLKEHGGPRCACGKPARFGDKCRTCRYGAARACDACGQTAEYGARCRKCRYVDKRGTGSTA